MKIGITAEIELIKIQQVNETMNACARATANTASTSTWFR